MKELPNYPENRLDIRMDEQGNMSYQQNPAFAAYYAPTREELKDRLELLELDEPDDCYSDEYDDWEEERRKLEDAIEALEDEIDEMN